MDLVRLEAPKGILQIDQLETKYDALLEQFVVQVSGEVETFLNRTVQAVTNKIEVLDVADGQYNFSLSAFPVTTVANVWNDTERVFGSGTIVAASSYYLNTATGWLFVDKVTPFPGRGVLKVQYTGGMAADTDVFADAFPDLAGAVAMEVAYRYQRKTALGLVAATVQGGSVAFPVRGQFLGLVESILLSHRRY